MFDGLLNEEQLEQASTVEKKRVRHRVSPNCARCKRRLHCSGPLLEEEGDGQKRILLVLPSPTRSMDADGSALRCEDSSSFDFLSAELREHGIRLERDCIITFAARCTGDPPTADEVRHCSPLFFQLLEREKPDLTLFFGAAGAQLAALRRWRETPESTGKWRGIPLRLSSGRGMVLDSPDDLNDQSPRYAEAAKRTWRRDLQRAVRLLDTPLPEYAPLDDSIRLLSSEEGAQHMRCLLKETPPLVAFDYETSGIKPEEEAHFIRCVSFCHDVNDAVAFIWDEKLHVPLMRKFANETRIGKIAQNMKFEERWTRRKCGVRVRNWKWDTMLAQHVQDNRTGIGALDFQALCRLNVASYDSHISPFLETEDAGGNAMNKIMKAPRDALLFYCAEDSLYEFRIAQEQMKEMQCLP